MATILKNNIKPGGSTLKGLVATDASGNQRDVKFVRQVDVNGVATTVYDTFDHYEYSEITITANHTYNDDVGANGSGVAVASAPTYKQTRWSVGASGAKYEETTLTTGATITYSGTHVAANGTVSGSSLGTTPVARNTSFASSVATVSMNGKSANTSGVAVAQAANAKTGTGNYNGKSQACYQSYTEYQVINFASVGDIPAYGGSSYAQGTGQSRTNYKSSSYTKYEIHDIYTSGDHKHNGTYTTAGSWTDGSAPSATAWGGNTTVKGSDVTGASLGKTTTTAKTNRGNSTTTWNGVACSAAIYQAINSKSSTAATALNGRSQSCYKAKTEYKVDGFASVGDIPAYGGSSYGQGTGYSRTNYDTSSYTKYDYYFTWTAYAGDANAKEFSYTSTKSGWTDGATPSAGAWGGATTVKGSTVSGTSLGTTTTSARTNKGNSTTTWNGVACSVAIYQAINAKSASAATALNGRTQACYKAVTEYQIINFASAGDVPASGGKSKGQGTGQSRTNYSTSSYTKYDYYFTWTAYAGDSNAKQFSYTSTASGWTDGSAPAAGAWGGNTTVTGSEVSGSNLTTNVKARTKLGASSVTWNGKTASADIYQAANALGTQHYKNTSGTTGDNWTYGTPSNPTLTSKLTAAGGSVTCSGSSVTNTKTYYLMYTSGSYSGLQTEKPAGSVGYTISSNGNSRFAFASGSGTVINHSNMTTNATTDTLGVKAYNASDSSKQSAQVTASVTNSYTDAWNAPSVSAFGYATSSFAYGGGTSAAPNSKTASQSGTRTFTSGSTSAISNSTFTWTYSTSSAGFSVNSSTGVVTAAANSGGSRNGVITATATGSGSKSGTKTFTFSQAASPTNGYEYVDLGLPSGLKWAKCLIGASNDTSAGTKYKFGATTPSGNYATYPSGASDHPILPLANDTARVVMGGSWRMATSTEGRELTNNTTNAAGTNACVLTSKLNSKKMNLYGGSGSQGWFWLGQWDTSSAGYIIAPYSKGGLYVSWEYVTSACNVRGVIAI